jgi:hypothetical protein
MYISTEDFDWLRGNKPLEKTVIPGSAGYLIFYKTFETGQSTVHECTAVPRGGTKQGVVTYTNHEVMRYKYI